MADSRIRILDKRERPGGMIELDLDLDGVRRTTMTIPLTSWNRIGESDLRAMLENVVATAALPRAHPGEV